jgi:hypothetical protein
MRRPPARGPLSAAVLAAVTGPVRDCPHLRPLARAAAMGSRDVLADEDVQLSLVLLQELHYRGLDGAAAEWEWAPDTVAARVVLERAVETGLRRLTAGTVQTVLERFGPAPRADDVARELFALVAEDDGPPLSKFLDRRASLGQYREFLTHRSIYHLKEADPHTWAIPRLAGRPKAALVEVQADEYGGGRPERMHSALFARTMRALGVDDTYGALLDRVPATTLATVTAITMFGLHRRLRGAVAGHLAAYEMTSSAPNRRYGNGLRRLGFDADATWFFDEHVEADAVHEQIAGRDLAGALVEDEPDLLPDVLLGAATALALDARAGGRMIEAWSEGRGSLLAPSPSALESEAAPAARSAAGPRVA